MPLKKQKEYRKIRCKYGLRSIKLYTFLCTDEIADALEEGDFVVVDSNEEFTIVQVVDESSQELSDYINYKYILRRL